MGHKVSLCKKDGNKKDGSNKDGLLHGESADDIRRFHVGHGCMVQGEMAVLRHQTAVENDFEEYKQRKGQVRHLVRQVLNGERSHPVVTVRKLALATQGKYRVPLPFRDWEHFCEFAHAVWQARSFCGMTADKAMAPMARLGVVGSAVNGYTTAVRKPLRAWSPRSDLDIIVFISRAAGPRWKSRATEKSSWFATERSSVVQLEVNDEYPHLWLSKGDHGFDATFFGQHLWYVGMSLLWRNMRPKFKLARKALEDLGNTEIYDIVWLPVKKGWLEEV